MRISRPSPWWPALLISGLVTVALFSAALVSMKSVLVPAASHVAADRSPTTVTFLETPRVPAPTPAPKRSPVHSVRRATPTAPTPPIPKSAPTPVVPTLTVPPVDSATKPAPLPLTPLVAPPIDATTAPERSLGASTAIRGAAAAPAGVTSSQRADRATATMTSRDSAFAAWARDAHEIARWGTMSREAIGDVAQSQRQSTQLAERVGTAGNSRDVHVMSGQGVGGVGAVGGGVSIPFPLFSNGPSRAQRVHDSIADADVRAGLARLAERIAARRDSIRADSVRADSVRADSARRAAQFRKP